MPIRITFRCNLNLPTFGTAPQDRTCLRCGSVTWRSLEIEIALSMSKGLQVLLSGVLSVPPFECAWLTGDDATFKAGTGCICFEAKAETDVTVIFKANPGAKRLQPLLRSLNAADPTALQTLHGGGGMGAHGVGAVAIAPATVEPNYTVILGSHRNS